MAQSPLLMRLVALSISTSKKAGEIIRDVMTSQKLNIVEKSKRDYQTEADRSAQKCIIASLSRHFPGVSIVGEEGESDLTNIPADWIVSNFDADFLAASKCPASLEDVSADQVVVWVDPLDGTLEFSENLVENTTVLIGIAVNNRAVAGVIHQPYHAGSSADGQLGRTVWGVKGLGIGGMAAKRAPSGEFTVITTRSHSNKQVTDAIEALSPTKVIRCGGAGFKVLQLLEGNAHTYVFASPGCKRWDTCAPEAILEAAGGILTDMHGDHYAYGASESFPNTRGVLGTGVGVNHQDIVKKIPDEIKQILV